MHKNGQITNNDDQRHQKQGEQVETRKALLDDG